MGKRTQIHEAISRLQHLTELFRQRRAKLALDAGLTEQQWLVIEKISAEHFIPSLFAKQRESSAAAVSRILRQLVDKGLVVVALGKGDGRLREYALTPRGERLMGRLRDLREEAIDNIWMALNVDDLKRFNRFADNLIASIEAFERKEA